MKPAALYIALMTCLPIAGQLPTRQDTVMIEEVTISSKIPDSISAARKISVSSSEISHFNGNSVSELISEKANIFIRSYGPGGSASASLRGTSASHTQLNWNGINIGNPMLGQADLSLFPAALFDNIHLFFGGGTIRLNSGGIGGIIQLESKPAWQEGNILSFTGETGSFGKISGLLKIRTGGPNLKSVTRIFAQSAVNNFNYINEYIGPNPVREQRAFNSTLQKGMIQEIYLKRRDQSFTARVWYQSVSRELPAPIIIHKSESNEKQFDQSIRTLLNYEKERGNQTIKAHLAALFDKLNYTNTTASIYSRNTISTITANASMETAGGENLLLLLSANNDLNIVNSNNYAERKVRNMFSVMTSARWYPARGVTGELLVREMLLDKRLLHPDLYAGISIDFNNNDRNILKACYSRNSRTPSLNDLYWVPGGDPDLENEYAHSMEFTWEVKRKLFDHFSVNTDITLYGNSINNMIKWLPGEFSYWIPSNIAHVNTSGIESMLDLTWSSSGLDAGIKTLYSYTRSVNRDRTEVSNQNEKYQLTYVPVNQLSNRLYISYRSFSLTFLTSFTGKRFLTTDNTSYLPWFVVNDLLLASEFQINKTTLYLNLTVGNIFNTPYQIIAYYPMPGRSFNISLTVNLTKQ